MSARGRNTFEENCQKLRNLMVEYKGSGLRFHSAPPEVVQAVMNREKLPEFDKASIDDRLKGCNYADYISKYQSLLWYEEIHAMIEMREHDCKDVRLTSYRIKTKGKPRCQLALNIPNISKGTPPVVAKDVFALKVRNFPENERYRVTSIGYRKLEFGSYSRPTSMTIENTSTRETSKLPYPSEWSKQNGSSLLTTKRIHGHKRILSPRVGDHLYIPNGTYFMGRVFEIRRIKNDTALLGKPQLLSSTYPNQIDLHKFDVKYDVYPLSSGIPFRKCHDALANPAPFLKEILCNPMAVIPSVGPLMVSTSNESELLRDSLAQLNEYQQVAVLNILAANCRPFPYMIFGPPGTGKTRTLIEAIVQIHGRDSGKMILVCANSNACADHLYEKLIGTEHIDTSMIERFVFEESSDKYKDGLKVRELHQPSSRIVVSTNISAGRLEGTQFDYIFLDEAGHCHEPEALVPWNRLREGGCMILAGDPYQLGPVIQSPIAAKYGLDGSILDYFFALERYRKTCGGYNNHFITKLNISYRCDPRILATSNRLFYDNEVICRGGTPDWLAKKLNINTPIMAINSAGRADRPSWSTSWRNQGEVAILLGCLDVLFESGIQPSQIGIISFYALQRDDINQALRSKKRERLEEGLDEDSGSFCFAATVDAFQGDERDIIIISTVRNLNHDGSTDGLQFLNDKRRFNVAVSRAKWLVIIIGQLELLRSSSHWSDYIGGAVCFES